MTSRVVAQLFYKIVIWHGIETFGILENWSLRRGSRLREVVATGGCPTSLENCYWLAKESRTKISQNKVNRTDSLIEENVERSIRTAEIIDIAYMLTYKSTNHMDILTLSSREGRRTRKPFRAQKCEMSKTIFER